MANTIDDKKIIDEIANMTLHNLQEYVYNTMKDKGFHDNDNLTKDNLLAKVCLIHTEISELQLAHEYEEDKDVKAEELADVAIRLMDFAGTIGIKLIRNYNTSKLTDCQKQIAWKGLYAYNSSEKNRQSITHNNLAHCPNHQARVD